MTDVIHAALESRVDVLALAARVRDAAMRELTVRRAHELSLVVAELAGNAVRHAGGGEAWVQLSAVAWTVEVVDRGPGFTEAVLRDGGRSDRLGPDGVRPLDEPAPSFGSGLASARRLASRLVIENTPGGGARAWAEWSDERLTTAVWERKHR
ncbi:MAG: sensor histidine kinase [Archangium sp.]|nr:sensor histidine kinase [Archangium sp.]